jgi:putative transposase
MGNERGAGASACQPLDFYRRRLPHWHPDLIAENPLFITWRLAGSLARPQVPRLPEMPAGRAFADWDHEMDKADFGPVWLQDSRVAQAVANALIYGQNERQFYTLHAWVIMPNHVHLVLTPKVPVPVITRWLKGSTARAANQILRRTGQPFWQDESFDHRVRNLDRVIRYVEHNPVNAGLVSRPCDWRWSSAVLAGESACPTKTEC